MKTLAPSGPSRLTSNQADVSVVSTPQRRRLRTRLCAGLCVAVMMVAAAVQTFAIPSAEGIVVVPPTEGASGSFQLTRDLHFTATSTGVVKTLVLDEWVTNDGAFTNPPVSGFVTYSINGGPDQAVAPAFFADNGIEANDLGLNDGFLNLGSGIAVQSGDIITLKAGTLTVSPVAGFNAQGAQDFTGKVFLLDEPANRISSEIQLSVTAVATATSTINNTQLLTAPQLTTLEGWRGQGGMALTRIYSKSSHPSTAAGFHAACDGKGDTFFVMEVTYNNVTRLVGGYNPQSWHSLSGYNSTPNKQDQTAFLFSLTTGVKYAQGSAAPHAQTFSDPARGPVFGLGHDLSINGQLNGGSSQLGWSYGSGPGDPQNAIDFLGHGSDFTIGRMEVFSVSSHPPVAVVAGPSVVSGLGVGGWKSDDTRSTTGADLVGTNSTHAGDPAVTPSGADDTAIAQQIKFVNGPAGSTYGGALSIDGTAENAGKSTVSVINTDAGFGDASSLVSDFTAQYQWYGQPNPTPRTLAFRIGVQSSQWAASQSGFTAQRSGESSWDLILVHVPASLSDNAWSTVNLDPSTGTWALFRQAGNGFFSEVIPAAMTLEEWNANPTWGPRLFGSGAKITNIQFGLGSSQKASIAYVDYLQTNLLNDGNLIDFAPAVYVNQLADYEVTTNNGTPSLDNGDIVTWTSVGAEPVPNQVFGTTAFTSIHAAVTAAPAGAKVFVADGAFDEQVVVTKPLEIIGSSNGISSLTFTGTVSGKATLFDVRARDVTIENFAMNVDLSKLSSAILASAPGGTIDGLKILNNDIMPFGSTGATFGSYGNRNAISINYANDRISGSGGHVTVNGNTVGYRPDSDPLASGVARIFRSAVSMDEPSGDFIGNTFVSVNHDILARFGLSGTIHIEGNTFNGGGVGLSEQNSGMAALEVIDNDFDGTIGVAVNNSAVLRLTNNQSNIPTTISGNTFVDHEWGISVENYKNLTISNNSFTPANIAGYRHITVNTKSLTSNSGAIVQTPVSATISGNTFNDASPHAANGVGIAFYNHDSDNASYGSFTVSGNNFNTGITTFILLDTSTGNTFPAPVAFPYYGEIGGSGGSNTVMAPWTADINAAGNSYDVGTGLKSVATMTSQELFTLEGFINHGIDNAQAGLVRVKTGELFVSSPYTIQSAIDKAASGDVVNVGPGTYLEDVLVNKAITLNGAGYASTTIQGKKGGDNATVRVNASGSGSFIQGFTITREGNTVADWNDTTLNSAGVAMQGLTITNVTVRNNWIEGNRSAIDVNNSGTHSFLNNVITNNHTGVIFRNQTDGLTFTENTVTANRTVGVLFLDGSGGTNSPVQTALNGAFSFNNITGNWYGQIVDRQSGGSLPAPGTTNLKNFSGNWIGTTSPVVTTANSVEPGYASLIPVAYGGSATAPGGQPDIAGPASANIDFTPMLTTASDTDVESSPGRGTMGFQGNFNHLIISNTSPQTGSQTRVEEAEAMLAPGGTYGPVASGDPYFTYTAGNQTFNEDTTRTFNGNGKWQIADSDAVATTRIQVTISVVPPAAGTINLFGTVSTTSPSAINQGADNSSQIMLRGTIAQINGYLNGAIFTPAANYNTAAPRTAAIKISLDDDLDDDASDDPAADTIALNILPVNDVPTFTKVGGNVTVFEDSGAYSSGSAWATNMLPGGGAYPDNDQLSFAVTRTSGTATETLFSSPPAIDPVTGVLTFIPALDANGSTTFSVTLVDNGSPVASSTVQTLTVAVTAVNDKPVLTSTTSLGDLSTVDQAPGSNAVALTVLEDSGAYSSGAANSFITNANVNRGGTIGNESAQTISFLVAATNTALFSTQPAISSTGILTFTPALNAYGSTTVAVRPKDNGLVANGGADTGDFRYFTINITPVNDIPSYTKGANITVLEDATAPYASLSNPWATVIRKGGGTDPLGPYYESGDGLTFVVSHSSGTAVENLFTAMPQIDASGNLSFTLKPDAYGATTFSVKLQDDGLHTSGLGGASEPKESAAQTFSITVTAVNDQPVLAALSPVTVSEDGGAQSFPAFVNVVSTFSSGGFNRGDATTANLEFAQTVTFTVTNDANALFATQPAISGTTGNLTFIPAANAYGTATVTVVPVDSGGTTNGGDNTGDARTFTITLNRVNDLPSFTKGPNLSIYEDGHMATPPGVGSPVYDKPWIANPAAILPGGGTGAFKETGDVLTFEVVQTSATESLFDTPPAVDPVTGNLSFVLKANANGTATFEIVLKDDGAHGDGGDPNVALPPATSAVQTFTIAVASVNDKPSFVSTPVDYTIDEDAPLQTYVGWGGGFVPGPANESGQQILDYQVTITDVTGGLTWANTPAVATSTGTLTFRPAANSNGSAKIHVVVRDNAPAVNQGPTGQDNDTSDEYTFTITVNPINDAPVVVFNTVAVNEDTGAHTIPYIASAIPGPANSNEGTQITSAQFISSTNAALFTGGAVPTISPFDPQNPGASTISFQAGPDRFGTSTVTVRFSDDGTQGSPHVHTIDRTFVITVNGVNDKPAIAALTNKTVAEDSGASSIAGFIPTTLPGLNRGDATTSNQENAQVVDYTVVAADPSLFSVQPAIGSSGAPTVSGDRGRLTFTTAENAYGSTVVTVTPVDNGGMTNGGNNTGDPQTFTITVTPVNDAPGFTLGATQTVVEDSGAHEVADFLTGVNVGPANEAPDLANPPTGYDGGQTIVSRSVSNNNNSLFSVQPYIDGSSTVNGTLFYTVAENATGLATVTVTVTDSGSGTSPHVNSTQKTFTIDVGPLPEVVTLAASNIKQGRATLNATVNPDAPVGAAATFQYALDEDLLGTDDAPMLETAASTYAPGSVALAQGNEITGLMPDTTYYYRSVALNAYGNVYGEVLSFTTLPDQWTWVMGSTGTNSTGSFFFIGAEDETNSPPSRQGAASWTSGGRYWVFGGVSPGSTGNKINDLWSYGPTEADPNIKGWVWHSGSPTVNAVGVYSASGVFNDTNTPGARHTCMTWTDASGRLWLFGGFGPGGRHNDLWCFNPSLGDNGRWAFIKGGPAPGQGGVYGTKGVAAAGNRPGGRQGGVAWADPDGNTLWLFGGAGFITTTAGNPNPPVLNDLWSYDISSGNWTWVSGPNTAGNVGSYGTKGVANASNQPGARRDAIGWVDRSGTLWMFGGQNGFAGAFLNDMWKYDSGTGNWTWVHGSNTPTATSVFGDAGVPDAANTPGARSAGGAVTMADGSLLMFGGMSSGFFNELWRFDWVTEEWTFLHGENNFGVYGDQGVAAETNSPGARFTPSVFADASNEALWVFGGGGRAASAQGRLSDLWKFDFAPIPLNIPDSDTDGLDDVWELANFGDLVSSEGGSDDFDTDGTPDSLEEAAGTDPDNAASKFEYSVVTDGSSGLPLLQVSPARDGVLYQVDAPSLDPTLIGRVKLPTGATGRILDTTRALQAVSVPGLQVQLQDTMTMTPP